MITRFTLPKICNRCPVADRSLGGFFIGRIWLIAQSPNTCFRKATVHSVLSAPVSTQILVLTSRVVRPTLMVTVMLALPLGLVEVSPLLMLAFMMLRSLIPTGSVI